LSYSDSYPHANADLQVADTVFSIHAYIFLRESDKAKALVEKSRESWGRRVVVDDVTAADMEAFVRVIYLKFVPFARLILL
jgi:hypothetical protein